MAYSVLKQTQTLATFVHRIDVQWQTIIFVWAAARVTCVFLVAGEREVANSEATEGGHLFVFGQVYRWSRW